ncbi:MAG: nuclear transport factor 2 family protein [Acidobacteriota bacterium]|nr:nuclear transport factor 2 family protein [Acidobacteriota bacterium]
MILLLCATLAAAQAEPEKAIHALLDQQTAAWNRGDLKGYMAGYWHSQDLTFFAADKESSGWEAAYQRYRTAYTGKGREMGRLNFSNVRVAMLGPDAAFARGTWQLTARDGSQRRGLFTLILRRIDGDWRIVHDHSS